MGISVAGSPLSVALYERVKSKMSDKAILEEVREYICERSINLDKSLKYLDPLLRSAVIVLELGDQWWEITVSGACTYMEHGKLPRTSAGGESSYKKHKSHELSFAFAERTLQAKIKSGFQFRHKLEFITDPEEDPKRLTQKRKRGADADELEDDGNTAKRQKANQPDSSAPSTSEPAPPSTTAVEQVSEATAAATTTTEAAPAATTTAAGSSAAATPTKSTFSVNPHELTVSQLTRELAARELPTNGTKPQLITRLLLALFIPDRKTPGFSILDPEDSLALFDNDEVFYYAAVLRSPKEVQTYFEALTRVTSDTIKLRATASCADPVDIAYGISHFESAYEALAKAYAAKEAWVAFLD